MLTIRKSTTEDLPAMLAIYQYARTFMAQNGNPNQWGPTNWPPEDLLKEDIAQGRSYVVISDVEGVVGTFCFLFGKDIEETYGAIEEGAWTLDAPYGVVHRLSSDGHVKGVAEAALTFALTQAGGHLRVDTHGDNKVVQSLLKKLGFAQVGIVHVVEDNYPRLAYEKIVTKRQ